MYGDFQCPYCSAAQSILRRVRERLDGQLRFAFRHLPLPEVHPDAERAAEAVEAAGAQGSFWEMYDALYASGGRLAQADLIAIADRLGLDVERFRADLVGGRFAARVARDADAARANGVTGDARVLRQRRAATRRRSTPALHSVDGARLRLAMVVEQYGRPISRARRLA